MIRLSKNMKASRAFELIAERFDEAVCRDGTYGVVLKGYRQFGICSTICYMRACGYVCEETAMSMQRLVGMSMPQKYTQSERNSRWFDVGFYFNTKTRDGARKRAAFARKLSKIAKKNEE